MRKIDRIPNGSGIFRPGQDLAVAGSIGKAVPRCWRLDKESGNRGPIRKILLIRSEKKRKKG